MLNLIDQGSQLVVGHLLQESPTGVNAELINIVSLHKSLQNPLVHMSLADRRILRDQLLVEHIRQYKG